MPIKRSSIKDVRRIKTRTALNLKVKGKISGLTKDIKKAMATGNKEEVLKLQSRLQQALDKAAKRHVIHRRKAGRKISRLVKATASK